MPRSCSRSCSRPRSRAALTELAGDAALPKSTASRLLGALERQGLVQQRGRRGSFEPGPVLLRFAARGVATASSSSWPSRTWSCCRRRAGRRSTSRCRAPLGVEHLAQVESRHFLGTGQWVGRRVPFHCTAVGKVLMAFGAAGLNRRRRSSRSPRPRSSTPRPLAAELERVRRDGCATAIDELEVGLSSLAAPVSATAECAALSISGPTLRLDAQHMAELQPTLIHEATALGRDMGVHAA